MANVLSPWHQLEVLNHLVEGTSLRSITRLTGVHRATIAKLMVRVGTRCRQLPDARMRNLALEHVECHEIWTFVRKQQGRLTDAESADTTIGDQFLFVAIDQRTKLIPCFALGKRTGETTRRFIDDLASRLVLVEPWRDGPKPRLSTDGWASYRPAIEDAFGERAAHGVIMKRFRESEQPGRCGPPVLEDTERIVVAGQIHPRTICRSHVGRSNLTIRTFLRRFTRLALGSARSWNAWKPPSACTSRTTISAASTARSARPPRWPRSWPGTRGRWRNWWKRPNSARSGLRHLPACATRPEGFSLTGHHGRRTMTAVAIRPSQVDFYARFLMGRAQFDPRHHGVDLDREAFIDLMVDEFNGTYQGRQTIDELLLHPREALRFCDDIRHKHGFFSMPDDIILRVIMQRRKNPPAA